MKVCPECEIAFEDDHNYCTTCGASLRSRNSSPVRQTHFPPVMQNQRVASPMIGWVLFLFVIAVVTVAIINRPSAQFTYPNTAIQRPTTGMPQVESDAHRTATEVLMTKVPYYHEHFSVEYNRQEKSFTITLFAILNHSWQVEQYQSDLIRYKQEALAWVACQGINTADVEIEYMPEEANEQPTENRPNHPIALLQPSPNPHSLIPSIIPVISQWSGTMATTKGTIYGFNLSLEGTMRAKGLSRVTGKLNQHNRKTGTQADEYVSGTIEASTGRIALEGEYFEPWPQGWFLDKFEGSIAENGEIIAKFYKKSDGQYLGDMFGKSTD